MSVFIPEKPKHGDQHASINSYPNKADKLFSGVSQASAEGYKDIYPLKGSINIEQDVSSGGIAGGGSSGGGQKHLPTIMQVPVDLKAGVEYTILATGGTAKYPLKAALIQDQLAGTSGQQ